MSRLLWARALFAVFVDDAEMDKISYSDGWVQCPGSNVVCESAVKNVSALIKGTVHMYV